MSPTDEDSAVGWLAGRVVSWSGQQLPGARLYSMAYSRSGRTFIEAVSDAAGRFRLGPLPVQVAHMFWCEAAQHARLRIGEQENPQVAVLPGATNDLGDIVLAPEIVAVGKVLDPDGAPVANAHVLAKLYYNQLAHTIAENGQSIEVRTAADGSFRLGSLAPGSLHVEVVAPGYPKMRTGAAIGCTDQEVVLEAIRFHRARTAMSGTVRDRKGRPVPGLRVTANGDEEEYATTDDAGRFHLMVRAERVLYAAVNHPPSGMGFKVGVKDPTSVDLTFDAPRFVEGWVKNATTRQPILIDELSICEVRRRELDGTESIAG